MPPSVYTQRYDLAVVGAGIVGLATALAATRQGLSVIVIDRDAQANGASVRNFGFVTVTGQERGAMWSRARRSRQVWSEVASAAGIDVVHTGLWMTARHPESMPVLEAFMATEMAEGCRLLTAAEARRRLPALSAPGLTGVLESTTEMRVESRDAIPRLARWLATARGVTFLRNVTVSAVDVPQVHTSGGKIAAERVVICPGDDYTGLHAKRLAEYRLTRCKLQMLRLASPGFRIPGSLMSDLGIGRYRGYSQLPEARPLLARLQADQPEYLRHGIHLIVVQSADGTLVVGDSHHYAATPDPFSLDEVDELILREFRMALGFDPPPPIERWIGTYASADDQPVLIDAPEPAVRIAIVTCGAGASTAFAIGEELVSSLLEA